MREEERRGHRIAWHRFEEGLRGGGVREEERSEKRPLAAIKYVFILRP